MIDLTHKAALVTGGSRGIGRGIVLELAKAGLDAAIVSVSADPAVTDRGAYKVRAEVEQLGRRAFVIKADVAREADWQRILEETLEAFGAVDLLVNNAGGFWVKRTTDELPVEEWQRVIDLNLTAVFLTARQAAPLLRRSGIPPLGRLLLRCRSRRCVEGKAEGDYLLPHYLGRVHHVQLCSRRGYRHDSAESLHVLVSEI